MNDAKQVVNRLDQIGQDLRQRPSIADEVMRQVQPAPRPPEKPGSHWLRNMTMLGTAACLLIAVTMWLSRPTSLYAQTVAALQRVDTIHVTGWTSRLVRKWPLENPKVSDAPEKHSVENWYWYDGAVSRSYEKVGPVVVSRDGNKLEEYQTDTDLLFVAESNPKDYVERFSTMSGYLQLLQQEGIKSKDLGTRIADGRTLRGTRVYRGDTPVEFWFDTATHLPAQFAMVNGDAAGNEKLAVLDFSYDDEVPLAAKSFEAPDAKHVRYGHGKDDQALVWNRHVQDIGNQMAGSTRHERVSVLPRQSARAFAYQYTKQTPDGNHWVLPLDHDQYTKLTVKYFIKLRVQTSHGERAAESWRIEEGLLDQEFPRSDLVFEEGVPWQEWVQTALGHLGLEYVDVSEKRTFWIAEHDGSKLREWRTVEPPVPYLVRDGEIRRGVVRPGIGHQLKPETMQGLFTDFNWMQNSDYQAHHPIMVDQTNLPKPPSWNRDEYTTWKEFGEAVNYDQYYVATDSPWFVGPDSIQMARDWYENELGLTIREEERDMTLHVVRKKAD